MKLVVTGRLILLLENNIITRNNKIDEKYRAVRTPGYQLDRFLVQKSRQRFRLTGFGTGR